MIALTILACCLGPDVAVFAMPAAASAYAEGNLPASEMSVRAVFASHLPDRRFTAEVGNQAQEFKLSETASVMKGSQPIRFADLKRGDSVTIYLASSSPRLAMHIEVQ